MSQNFAAKITEKAIGEFEGRFGRKPSEPELTEYMWTRGYQNLIRQNNLVTQIALNQPVVRGGDVA